MEHRQWKGSRWVLALAVLALEACGAPRGAAATTAPAVEAAAPTCEQQLLCNAPVCHCPERTRCALVGRRGTVGAAECVPEASGP